MTMPLVDLNILVNGQSRRCPVGTTLSGLLEQLGLAGSRVATALNGTFVPERERSGLRLAAGDTVEIVAPRPGG